jgi:hypothetical protein
VPIIAISDHPNVTTNAHDLVMLKPAETGSMSTPDVLDEHMAID